MRPITRLAWTGVLGGILLLAVACGSEGPTASPGGPVATPNVQATIEALARRPQLGTPTPTPVPAAARAVAVEFATGHRAITKEWDAFQGGFNSWRERLVACDASSVRVALQQFGGRFSGVTEAARALPRPSIVRELADKLIQASEKEDEALRLLRDTWRPEDSRARPRPAATPSSANSATGDVAVFERVQVARSAAATLRKEVADALTDRAAKTTLVSLGEVAAFRDGFKAVDSAWDGFHIGYDSFRSQQDGLTPAEAIERFGKLVDRFRDIVAAVRGLPANDATEEVAEKLAKAAEEEDLLLRKLRGVLPKGGASGAGAGEAGAGEAGAGKAGAGEAGAGKEKGSQAKSGDKASSDSTAASRFDEFDAQLVKTNAARRQAGLDLITIVEDLSTDTQNQVGEFIGKYNPLTRQWDGFHRDYDEWRRTEGGCDRSKAIETLGQFNVAFAEIAGSVRGLPSATLLRPLGEILVEAAEREAGALRGLRNTWQPFDTSVYDRLDQERNTAGKLRRQVTVGVQDLLERYGIPSSHLE